jgi:RsiW-degrading membrane proteinase PrsW (M82 family)
MFSVLSDFTSGAIVAAAIAPALMLLWLVVTADSRPEPPRVIWICVLLGALSTLPAALIEIWLEKHIPIVANSWVGAYARALLFAGLPEELLKVSIIAAVARRARDFDEPMDGVVYGTAVGLGFAALENIAYVAGNAHWAAVAVVRGILSVPFHGALGAIAGAYLARARFGGALGGQITDRRRRQRLLLSAWLIPIALHTLYDGLPLWHRPPDAVSIPNEILMMALVSLAVAFGAIVFAVVIARRIGRHQKAWMRTKRLLPIHWRGVWAQSMLGVGLSFVAVSLMIAGNSVGRIAGCILMVASFGVTRHCGKYLNEAAIATQRMQPALSKNS